MEYQLDEFGSMQVAQDTSSLYRYPDLTMQAEALFGFIRDTLDTALRAELDYLVAVDAARARISAVLDMPDRKLDLFIWLCMQGRGRISDAKRNHFPELDEDDGAYEVPLSKIVFHFLDNCLVAGVSRPYPAPHGDSLAGHRKRDDNLGKLGMVVLAVAPFSKAIIASILVLYFEIWRSRIQIQDIQGTIRSFGHVNTYLISVGIVVLQTVQDQTYSAWSLAFCQVIFPIFSAIPKNRYSSFTFTSPRK